MAVANLFVLLLGAGLLAVPIILHLLMQPKPKPLVFPGLRFLQKTASSNRRQLRVRQWVLCCSVVYCFYCSRSHWRDRRSRRLPTPIGCG